MGKRRVRTTEGGFQLRYPDPSLGTIFGNYTVSGKTHKSEKSNNRKCECTCSCGKIRDVPVVQLYTGRSTSCRCVNMGKRLRPFENLYNRFRRVSYKREITCDLTYEEFLESTKITQCHYCTSHIEREPYNNCFKPNSGHNLDRKDNAKGYSKENCVVACKRCNQCRSNQFTYEEWLQIGKLIGSWKK
jgi:hypothetical protein